MSTRLNLSQLTRLRTGAPSNFCASELKFGAQLNLRMGFGGRPRAAPERAESRSSHKTTTRRCLRPARAHTFETCGQKGRHGNDCPAFPNSSTSTVGRGCAGHRQSSASADRLGAVISDDRIQKADEATDKLAASKKVQAASASRQLRGSLVAISEGEGFDIPLMSAEGLEALAD